MTMGGSGRERRTRASVKRTRRKPSSQNRNVDGYRLKPVTLPKLKFMDGTDGREEGRVRHG